MEYEPLMDSPLYGISHDNDPKYQRGFMSDWENKMVCPICGKEFPVYDREHHVYRIGGYKHQRPQLVCSWNCQRRWEKEIRQPISHGSKMNWRRSIKDALARKAECLKRIELYSERQKFLVGYENHRAGQNVSRWRKELEEVEEFLTVKGATDEQHGQED